MTNRECIAQASNLSRSRSPKRHNFVMKLQQFKNNQSLVLVVRYLGFALCRSGVLSRYSDLEKFTSKDGL